MILRHWRNVDMLGAGRRNNMTTWNIDSSHSGVHFAVRHMVVTKVRGAFTRYQGTINFDEQNPQASKVSVRIEAASIDTREPQRDAHLRSADFFDVERCPTLSFESTKVEKLKGNNYRVTGDLVLHGVTKPVELEVEYLGVGKDPYGNERIGFQAETSINRKDFGLNWNQALETGGVLVGDKVEISIDLQGVKAQSSAQAA
jgi:polyisoprenoid-binding protein YceI